MDDHGGREQGQEFLPASLGRGESVKGTLRRHPVAKIVNLLIAASDRLPYHPCSTTRSIACYLGRASAAARRIELFR